MRQRSNAQKTPRRSWIPSRILRTLHATRQRSHPPKTPEVRQFSAELGGRFTRQRADPPWNPYKVVASEQNSEGRPRVGTLLAHPKHSAVIIFIRGWSRLASSTSPEPVTQWQGLMRTAFPGAIRRVPATHDSVDMGSACHATVLDRVRSASQTLPIQMLDAHARIKRTNPMPSRRSYLKRNRAAERDSSGILMALVRC